MNEELEKMVEETKQAAEDSMRYCYRKGHADGKLSGAISTISVGAIMFAFGWAVRIMLK